MTVKIKIVLGALACLLLTAAAGAETRTYYQVKDIAARENGQVSQSEKKSDLFEYSFSLDRDRGTVTRTAVRRLDKPTPEKDATVYRIVKKVELPGSAAGNGGKALIAVRQDGCEIVQLGHRFAFTMRTSPFSQVITGIYKRDYKKDHQHFRHSRHREKSSGR
jgi:hypothetical protein